MAMSPPGRANILDGSCGLGGEAMRYRRDVSPGATYFFTVVTAERRPVFRDAAMVRLLVDILREEKARRPFRTEALVILPDHLHTIWTLPHGDARYPQRWSAIKGLFSRRCGLAAVGDRLRPHERGIWQHRYWEHRIRDDDDFRHHVEYIHANPVKHGLVESPTDWPWSTIHRSHPP